MSGPLAGRRPRHDIPSRRPADARRVLGGDGSGVSRGGGETELFHQLDLVKQDMLSGDAPVRLLDHNRVLEGPIEE